jgi:nitroreductase
MLELLRKRRSIRKFKKGRIDPARLDELKEAALRAPSSRGIKPWKFFFVQDAEMIKRLSICKEHGSSYLKPTCRRVGTNNNENRSPSAPSVG